MECIRQEAILRKDYLRAPIATIYFGGGTPSIMAPSTIARIIDTIRAHYNVTEHPEITLEANPDDIQLSHLRQWQTAGINRLSIGIQSFHTADLEWMNRAHNEEQSLAAIQDSQAAGITNLSIDLIYGTPYLTDELWAENLEIAASLQVPHISAYALTVEPKTALYKMIEKGKIPPVDQEKQTRHFEMLMDFAAQSGLEHYEISNLAKPGFRSQHNSNYWHSVPYLGLGPAAHSFDGDARQWNIANNQRYIQSMEAGQREAEAETLTLENKINERIMIQLRLIEGLSLKQFEALFGADVRQRLVASSHPWQASGQLIIEKDHLILTRKGKHFADTIAADLFV